MTRRRFYAPLEAFAPDKKSVTLRAEEARHLRDVLRLKAGDGVYIFDGAGREFRGEVQTIGRDSTEVSVITEVEPARPESSLNLTLAIALLKGEKFDLVVQKATELGVSSIVPVITSRADVRIRGVEEADRKLIRWQRIAMEATKQCGRARLMKIEPPATFTDLIKRAEFTDELRLMFAERDGVSLRNAFAGDAEMTGGVIALVGSEGGWADEEIAEARSTGWQIVTLGGRIMRAETAAIAIATLLQHRFGDLN
jgi:16S rRNA (uracil1498-N3)-methyltransferase